MSKKTIYWLGAVDGTCSSELTTENKLIKTHIWKIWSKFKSNKYYSHGPNVAGIREIRVTKNISMAMDFTGSDGSDKILTDTFNAFKRFLKSINYNKEEKNSMNENKIKICLIGYSRGAVICIDLVKKIYDEYNIKTYFLGLLDPVNRDVNLTGHVYYSYIENIFITRRNLNTDRQWMGWAGLNNKIYTGYAYSYIKEWFTGDIYNTTHGGMGGYFTKDEYSTLKSKLKEIKLN